MSSVYRYRVFCETEQSNVYIWDTSQPIVCPNNNSHIINTGSIVIVDQVKTTQTQITNFASDNTEKLNVVSKNVIFNLLPFFGVSLFRNNIITEGSGSVTNNNSTESEIRINCSGSNDSAILRSIERGIYTPGLTCEVGIGIRLPSNGLTGNQVLKWGYFGNLNGFYFKLTSTVFSVCILNNSVETCISQQNFSSDKLDGNGKSSLLIDFSKGNIFNIEFSWYGYGLVTYKLYGQTLTSRQSSIKMHEYQTVGQTSTRLPNLPIQVILDNNGTVANTDVFVSGRQFSVLGNYTPTIREVSMFKYLFSISNEIFLPVFSVRREQNYIGCTIKLANIVVKSSVDCEVKILSNSTLTSNNWVRNPYTSESACEVDTSATNVNENIIIDTFVCFNGEKCERELINYNIHLNELLPITISCKSLTGQTGSITCCLRWLEYW